MEHNYYPLLAIPEDEEIAIEEGEGIVIEDDAYLSNERLRNHFRHKLRAQLRCEIPEHKLCFRVHYSGYHKLLSREEFQGWVEALAQGEATMTRPPRNLGINSTVSTFSLRPNTPASRTLYSVPNTSVSIFSLRTASSGVPGPGYYTGKALRWIGEKSLRSVEQAFIRNHIRRFRQMVSLWQRYPRRYPNFPDTWLAELQRVHGP
ncbi:hypothetical protein M422DRAFT_66504, partial [Sphaerobolus stellatus SS14]